MLQARFRHIQSVVLTIRSHVPVAHTVNRLGRDRFGSHCREIRSVLRLGMSQIGLTSGRFITIFRQKRRNIDKAATYGQVMKA